MSVRYAHGVPLVSASTLDAAKLSTTKPSRPASSGRSRSPKCDLRYMAAPHADATANQPNGEPTADTHGWSRLGTPSAGAKKMVTVAVASSNILPRAPSATCARNNGLAMPGNDDRRRITGRRSASQPALHTAAVMIPNCTSRAASMAPKLGMTSA
jgi:hypothetical protein